MAGFDQKRFEALQGGGGKRDDEEYDSGRIVYRTAGGGRIERRPIKRRVRLADKA